MAFIIAVGNPGVGKSTILNSLAEEHLFKSGTSFGGGLTYQLDERSNKNGRRLFDTPGLADRKLREQAGQAITQALNKGGEYQILFFLRTESGRAVGEDITTFKLVLDSAPEIGDQYGIVINKVNSKMSKKLQEHPDHAKAFMTEILANIDLKRHCNWSNITFLPIIHDVEEENDTLIPVNDLKTIDGKPFKNYVTEDLTSVKLTQGKANDIAIQDFEKATEEIETLKKELKENRTMFEKRQMEMEQEMIRKVQQAQQAIAEQMKENQKTFEKKQMEMEQNMKYKAEQAEQALGEKLKENERMYEKKQKEMEQAHEKNMKDNEKKKKEREIMATVNTEGSCRVYKNTQLSGINITNDLSQGDVTDIEIISVISEKGANIASYTLYIQLERCECVGEPKKWTLAVKADCNIFMHNPSSGGQQKLECSLRFNEDYRHYWQFKFKMGREQYRINKNTAMANVWEMDNRIPRFILLEEGGHIRINMMFNSGTAYFYCEKY